MSLKGKKILLGVTGSIAAYKTALLTRLLIKEGASVKIIMTPSACGFITPLTMSTLSKHPVHTDVSDGETWDNHVELGLWADFMVIAPCTATTLSKLASGHADNMLVASYLSAKCPVYIAPAMDLDMWKHGSTLRNIDLLQSYGNKIIPVGDGELASGLVGKGRMAEPEDIVDYLIAESYPKDLIGKTFLVTAGPTREPLDPVRFISNHSTGKMGIAIAEEAAHRGATVHLVLGPTNQSVNPGINVYNVMSAQEMYDQCMTLFPSVDAAVMTAAVADYTPATQSDTKIKKKPGDMYIDLKRTPDIAGSLGKIKGDKILIGFALETNNEEANAQKKLHKKNLDFVVLNSLQDKGAGFGHDTNKVTFIYEDKQKDFDLKSKKSVAIDIVDDIFALLTTKK